MIFSNFITLICTPLAALCCRTVTRCRWIVHYSEKAEFLGFKVLQCWHWLGQISKV